MLKLRFLIKQLIIKIAKIILIQVLTIIYIIKLILAKYFVFIRFDTSISNKNKVISYIKIFADLILSIL